MIMAIGSVGLICLIVAFTLVDIGKLKPSDRVYNFLNFIGSLALILYSLDLGAYIFVILESFWAVISLFEIIIPHNSRKE